MFIPSSNAVFFLIILLDLTSTNVFSANGHLGEFIPKAILREYKNLLVYAFNIEKDILVSICCLLRS